MGVTAKAEHSMMYALCTVAVSYPLNMWTVCGETSMAHVLRQTSFLVKSWLSNLASLAWICMHEPASFFLPRLKQLAEVPLTLNITFLNIISGTLGGYCQGTDVRSVCVRLNCSALLIEVHKCMNSLCARVCVLLVTIQCILFFCPAPHHTPFRKSWLHAFLMTS